MSELFIKILETYGIIGLLCIISVQLVKMNETFRMIFYRVEKLEEQLEIKFNNKRIKK